MLLVIIGVLLIVSILCGIAAHDTESANLELVTTFSSILLFTTLIMYAVLLGFFVNTKLSSKEELALYEENNLQIEEKLSATIEGYKNYEKGTFSELKPESADEVSVWLNAYPELKTDEMVQGLLKTQVENNEKIREIKLELIDNRVNAFWLWFGGGE